MKYSPTYWYCIRSLLTRAFGLLIPVTTEANAESNWQFIASSMCLESFCPALPPTSRTSLTVVLSLWPPVDDPVSYSGGRIKALWPSGATTFHSYFGISTFSVSLSLAPYSCPWFAFQINCGCTSFRRQANRWFLLLRNVFEKLKKKKNAFPNFC